MAEISAFTPIEVAAPNLAATNATALRQASALPNIPDLPGGASRLRAEAERFEAAFLAEMLRHAGLGQMPESFSGGAGEAAFSGSLIQEYANQIAGAGNLGLADQIYRSLAERNLK